MSLAAWIDWLLFTGPDPRSRRCLERLGFYRCALARGRRKRWRP